MEHIVDHGLHGKLIQQLTRFNHLQARIYFHTWLAFSDKIQLVLLEADQVWKQLRVLKPKKHFDGCIFPFKQWFTMCFLS